MPKSRPPRNSRTSSPSPRPDEDHLAVKFIETFCRHTTGEWAGQSITLEDFQKRFINKALAVDPTTGLRRYRTAYWGMPRKNGKSTIGSGLALYGLIADGEPGAQVYSVAGDRQQARIVFEDAKKMIRADPDLSDVCTIMRDSVFVKETNSVFRVLSADAGLQQGLNPSFVIFDEVHVQPDEDLWAAMTQGSAARRQPIVIGITTAGFDEDTLAYRLYDHGRGIARGEIDDPTFFFEWIEPGDPGADHRDPAVWLEVNPLLASGALKIADFEAQARSTPESIFRRFRLNQWVPSEEFWLPSGAWEACREGDPDKADWLHDLDREMPVAVGIDIGIVHDASAVLVAQNIGGVVTVRGRYWMNPYPTGTIAHDEWRMPVDELIEVLRSLRRTFPRPAVKLDGVSIPGPAYVYDRYGLASAELTLERERGFALVPIGQSGGWMIEASRRFYEAVKDQKIRHDGDPTLAEHIRNVVPRQVGESGWRLEKASARKKIDGAVAAVMAVSQALERPPTKTFKGMLA